MARLPRLVLNGSYGLTRFLNDGDALVGEYNSAGTMLRRYVHGSDASADDPMIWYEGSGYGDPRWLLADERGSITAISKLNAGTPQLLAINRYDEYGIPQSTNQGRFQYTGQAWLPELGMYYYKARMYSPTMGRFMQTDPIGYKDQVNLYAYVANDPVDGVDPTGMCGPATPVCIVAGEEAWVGIVAGVRACAGNATCRAITVGAARWVGRQIVEHVIPAILPSVPHGDGKGPSGSSGQGSGRSGAPAPNNGQGPQHGNEKHDNAIRSGAQEMQEAGYSDIRKNQTQVDANGNRVGNNRPDLQGTDPKGTREIREYDNNPSRSQQHGETIRQNDPSARCILKILC